MRKRLRGGSHTNGQWCKNMYIALIDCIDWAVLGCSKQPHSQSTIDFDLNQAKEGVSANIKYHKYKHTLELFGSAEQKVRGKVKFVVQQLKRFSSHILLLPIYADDHSLTDTFA